MLLNKYLVGTYLIKNVIECECFVTDKSLRAGTHCYPFHFALPHNLPSTFKSSIASVNYYVKVKSKPACKVKTSVTFNVLANVNLNNDEDMLVSFDVCLLKDTLPTSTYYFPVLACVLPISYT